VTKILVVDDEPQILRALRINLRARQYDVEVAADGASALRVAASQQPDLVVLDLGLPDMDGVDVIRGLRGWTTVPIIVLSGRAGSADKVTALDAGADDYITKPFGVDELLDQHLLDLPDDLLSLGDVGFLRLCLEELLDLRVAVLRVVAVRIAGIGFGQRDVGVVDARPRQIETDRIVLSRDAAVPDGRLDDLQLGVEVDAIELIDEQHRRVLEVLEVARRHLDLQPLLRAVAQALHDAACLGLPRGLVAAVARQRHRHLPGHPP